MMYCTGQVSRQDGWVWPSPLQDGERSQGVGQVEQGQLWDEEHSQEGR